ncbi:helix-turn-helix transcriptional regulator [Noviherbaspirillum sedimenti]|uniref:AlpA family phage regulatory protein n=1 Tax=Noviherbaspirillum sedimenti TaxID=2320865 RepID=A0A3A3G448_9BURK|nr:AlpA family phage regulatory protein [Noviherbaspirillum sedimenti]RJG01272.1 AlpA family phage regulatory protein [Noviherbaspirillum sedimenti]
MSQKLFRLNDLASTPGKNEEPAKIGLLPVSPATIWRWVREGKFPKPFKLGDSVTVWDAAEVEAFIAQRAGGADQ